MQGRRPSTGSSLSLLRDGVASILALLAAIVLLGSIAPGAGADALDSSLPLQTSYRDEVMADGPAAYWRLGEASGTVALDELGASNGSYAGGVALGQPGALADGSTGAAFDGVNGRMVVPSSSVLNATAAVTVEMWARRTKSAAYQVLVGKPGNGQSKFENYAIWFNTSNRLQAYFGNGTTYVTVTSGVLNTAWHQIVATYDNATARVYVDGALVASATSTVALTPNTLPLNLGRTNDGQYYFGGALDEVAVYQKALSASRIQAHYLKALVDSTAPTVTLTQPAGGSSTNAPWYAGVAGTTAGDSTTVTVRVYAGSAATGTPVQTLGATRQSDGSYSVTGPAPADGVYTAQAEQSDSSGNVGRSASTTFTVDTTAPTASIASGPQGTVASTSATFGLAADDASATFQCSLDGGAFAACASPKSYTGLADGGHTFSVRAVDAAGNVGSAASATW
ncbi:MAG: Ig-like domain-containing protein, partial [Solirubrobacteraceae bacterium]|nr:Ig-like domain-containing protein [Solirubrobacteraceae bacterium]